MQFCSYLNFFMQFCSYLNFFEQIRIDPKMPIQIMQNYQIFDHFIHFWCNLTPRNATKIQFATNF